MSVATLRSEAKKLKIPISEIRGVTDEDELQAIIDRHKNGGNSASKPVAKKKKASTAAGEKVAVRAAKKNAQRKQTDRKSAGRKSSPATSTKKSGTAKRTTAAKPKAKRNSNDGGRNLLENVDFTVTEGWNPREGSAPDRIVRALRKARGNRAKAFDALVGDLWDFVAKKNSKGEKRGKAEAEWQLRYRISRTAWDFAKRTGQHEPSTNRATYGEGGTGIGVSGGMPVAFRPEKVGKPVFKRGKKRSTGKATTAKRSTAKRATAKRSTAKRTTAKRKTTSRR